MPYYIGLMSGTSLDGCDAALVEIERDQVKLISFLTMPMPIMLRDKVLDCCSEQTSNIRTVCSLNFELGEYFASAALAVCRQANITPDRIRAVGSHGQTVYHISIAAEDAVASTLQLGEPAIIAHRMHTAVVSSFRAMDMAADGRGAPLVPYAEYWLYRTTFGRALQNLGGIGNVTVLPANCALDQVTAFDTGPGNMMIDSLCRRFFDRSYDAEGALAAQGHVAEPVLRHWMRIPFIQEPPPKATGREVFGEALIEETLARFPDVPLHDWVATATRFTAESIITNYQRYVLPAASIREIILSGGGSHNTTLRRWIAEGLPEQSVITQEQLGWDSDAKEAVAFAVMTHETLHSRPSNVPTATGATQPVILGTITQGEPGLL